jgi:hypothetical protein
MFKSNQFAFFTRTQTGALISRINSDVIGAQQAFTATLSGVVSNVSKSGFGHDYDANSLVADNYLFPPLVTCISNPNQVGRTQIAILNPRILWCKCRDVEQQ